MTYRYDPLDAPEDKAMLVREYRPRRDRPILRGVGQVAWMGLQFAAVAFAIFVAGLMLAVYS